MQTGTFAGIFKTQARPFVKHCMKRNKVFDVSYKVLGKKLQHSHTSKIEGTQRIISKLGVYVLLARTWEYVAIHLPSGERRTSTNGKRATQVAGSAWKITNSWIMEISRIALRLYSSSAAVL
jgi:hypothetical protein